MDKKINTWTTDGYEISKERQTAFNVVFEEMIEMHVLLDLHLSTLI